MDKFPKIRYPNDEQTDGLLAGNVVVTEKLDGANFRFMWDDDGQLRIGTRNVLYDSTDDENIPHAFRHAIEYLQSSVEKEDAVELTGTFYGEAMHLHSIEYKNIDYVNPHKGSRHPPVDEGVPNVVVFDRKVNGDWCAWDDVVKTAERLGLEHVPVLERGSPDDCEFTVPDESVFGGPPEGIVIRRDDGSVRAKKVTDDFKEKNSVAFEDPSKAQSDAAEFVAMYVTEARIEKMVHKLVDEGEYESIKMEMMEQLPKRVLSDVMAEEGWDLLTNNFEAEWDSDFKSEVRSKASSKCARVCRSLAQEI